MVSIKKIPDEVLQQIFLKLDDTSLFNASMTCRQWKLHLLPKLPPFKQLHIDLDSLACCGRILYVYLIALLLQRTFVLFEIPKYS